MSLCAQELDAVGGPHADAREELQELKDEFARRLGAADRSIAALRVRSLPVPESRAAQIAAQRPHAAVQCNSALLLSVPEQGTQQYDHDIGPSLTCSADILQDERDGLRAAAAMAKSGGPVTEARQQEREDLVESLQVQ